nr:MAG TPA: hypothetical protein [Caudoviricetes sp.]
MVMTMKAKKIRFMRPEVECTLERPILGRLLFPFFVVAFCWTVRKYFIRKISITLSGKTLESFWLVILPKFRTVDAE